MRYLFVPKHYYLLLTTNDLICWSVGSNKVHLLKGHVENNAHYLDLEAYHSTHSKQICPNWRNEGELETKVEEISPARGGIQTHNLDRHSNRSSTTITHGNSTGFEWTL